LETALTVEPSRSITTCFEDVVTQWPERRALCWRDGAWSYAELNARANRLAHLLIRMGIKAETPVGVFALRSPQTLLSFLAILKAGGAYVPLDPTYPPDLIKFYLDDAAIQFVLTDPEQQSRLPATSAQIIPLDVNPGLDQSEDNPLIRTRTGSLAHILFTSGSTGKPKGVLIEDRGVLRVTADLDYAQVGPNDVFLQYAPLNFDASTFELWAAWLKGACVAVPEPGLTSLHELGLAIRSFGVSTLWLTSGLFQLMVEQEIESLANVRQLLTGGDVVSPIHAERFLRKYPHAHLINGYGPTEGTVFTACHRIQLENPMPAQISIGCPVRKTDVLILDEHLQPTSKGEPGEIVITGEGLARGYLNRPDLNAQSFVQVQDRTGEHVRAYRSGDLGRYQADGTLEFMGRMDHQIKINGLRIELGELEAILQSHPGVSHATVVAVEVSGKKHLEAFVVLRAGASLDGRLLRGYLAHRIPANWLPASIRFLPALPLNANGKVDRAALRAQAFPAIDPEAEEYVQYPEDYLEKAIWAIWQDLLPGVTIARFDNFFDLGGDSLAAMNMLAQVEKVLGRSLTLRPLLEGGTIASLAAAARETGPVSPPPLMTYPQVGGALPPFFFAHGDYTYGGLYCQGLAQKIGPDRPFYAISPPGTYDDRLPSSVEEIATLTLDLIRSVQPKGPYHLGGFCNGALAMYETAQRLIRAGETVATLVLLDPPDYYLPTVHQWMRHLVRMAGLNDRQRILCAGQFIDLVSHYKFDEPGSLFRFMRDKLVYFPLKKIKQLFLASPTAVPLKNLNRYYIGLLSAYAARPYSATEPVTILLRHAEQLRHPHQMSYWRRLIPQAEFAVVVGTHLDFKTSLGPIAQAIRAVLDPRRRTACPQGGLQEIPGRACGSPAPSEKNRV
jgi:amino acid adenylation domain-containing protein